MEPLPQSIVLTTSIAFAELSLIELEKPFWDCDFTATYSAIALDEAVVCNEMYTRLKEERFTGNFGDFLVWWRVHENRELTARVKPR